MENEKKNAFLFAKNFSKLPNVGPLYFVYRDLPDPIKKFVSGKITLDYGCGPATSSPFLKSIGLDVDGVDICNHMITLAKELDPSGKYYLIESAKVASPDGFYDFVYAGFVFPLISSKFEMLKIVKEVTRILKPGGIFIISSVNENVYKYKWLDLNVDFDINKNPASGSVVRLDFKDYSFVIPHYYWTEEDYCEAISKGGLDLISIHKPLGTDSDKIPWITEKEVPMINIYIAKKSSY